MKKHFFFLLIALLASGLLFGCITSPAPDSIQIGQDETVLIEGMLTPTATTLPQSTLTAASSISDEPSPTPEPEPTPTPTPTQQPLLSTLGQAPIDAASLNQLEVLETIGAGRISRLNYHQDAGVFIIQTAQGVYLYDGESLDRTAFFEFLTVFHQIPGKSSVVAVSPEKNLVIIDLQTGQVIQTLVPEDLNDWGNITISQNGKMMGVVFVRDHETRIDWEQFGIDVWDLEQYKLVARLTSDLFGFCSSLAFTEDNTQLLADCYTEDFSMFKKLVLWDIAEQEVKWYLSNEGLIMNAPFSKDGSLFTTYVVFDDTTGSSQITIRRTLDGTQVGRVGGKLSDNAFSNDSEHIITTSSGQIVVWHTTDSQRVKAIDTGLDSPTASYSDDGQHILVNGGEQAWDAVEFVLDEEYQYVEPVIPEVSMSLWRQIGHLDGINGVKILDDGRMMVWGLGEDDDLIGEIEDYNLQNTVIWRWYPDTNTYDEVSVGKSKGYPVLAPNQENIAICTDEGLKIIALDQKLYEVFENYCKSPWPDHVAFSADGEQVFVTSGSLIDVISVESGEVLQQLRAQDLEVGYIQTINSGDFLITSSAGKISGGCETILWELNPLNFIRKWIIPGFVCLQHATIDHAQHTLVTINEKVSVWRLSDGWYLTFFDGNTATFSEDDGLLAVGSGASGINFYETDNWELIANIIHFEDAQPPSIFEFFGDYPGTYSAAKSLQFYDQDQLLISVHYGDVIRLWGVP